MSGKPSRRSVVQALLATGALGAARVSASQARTDSSWMLLGTGKGEGIFRARWNAHTGEIGAPELAIATSRPSFLTLHPRLPVVYSCNEDDAPKAAVTAFALDRRSATLKQLATQQSHGSAPCYVSVDRTGRLLFAANYSGGSLAAFALNAQGHPAAAARVFECNGNPVCGTKGPVSDRQDGAHIHCATLSPDNRFVLACDLGDDSILVFPIHPGTAQPLGEPIRVPTAPGAGPRHLAFHPNGQLLYCITELDCTVVPYRWLPGKEIQAEAVQGGSVSIKPADAANATGSTGAEIAITRDGRFAYASTRFSDLLTVFRIDTASGKLTQAQQLPCGGKVPRFFALDPSERWVLCANQDSDTISVFSRDAASGELTAGKTFPASNPQCILWV